MGKIFSLLVLSSLLYSWQPAAAQSVSVTATSWLVADGTGKTIDSVNADEERSIASITKLMTAMVVLDANQDLSEKIGQYTREDLLQMMLIKSDNHAAEKLCSNYPSGRVGCITAMNHKAHDLGLQHTRFADASGLNIMNISTANDLVHMVMEASKYKEIVKASNTSQANVNAGYKKKKKRYFSFYNTNPLVAKHDFIVSKTGYIRASGGCIVMMLDTKIGQRIVVLLNSKNTKTRIPEAFKLAQAY